MSRGWVFGAARRKWWISAGRLFALFQYIAVQSGWICLLVTCLFLPHHTSPQSTDDSPLGPDKDAIITIAIPLFQLTVFHILSLSAHRSRHRLIPTALISFLSLAHFRGALYHHLFGSSSASPTGPTISLARLKSTPYEVHLPFTQLCFATVLIGTILLTISLNVSGQGPIRKGDETTTLGFFQQLPYEEDFGIFLRVTTASLEATGLLWPTRLEQ
ncbi:hypothetical protein BYT27DRAFT_7249639 [Phlegmacium glaucopus]|nr:hypothetical protein BYT27DRAFT_7249639 [Phlegmacium glaucopus]